PTVPAAGRAGPPVGGRGRDRAMRAGRGVQRGGAGFRGPGGERAVLTWAGRPVRSFAVTLGLAASTGNPTGSRSRLARARTIVAVAAWRSGGCPVPLGTVDGGRPRRALVASRGGGGPRPAIRAGA